MLLHNKTGLSRVITELELGFRVKGQQCSLGWVGSTQGSVQETILISMSIKILDHWVKEF